MLANKAGVKPIHNAGFEVLPGSETKCKWLNGTLVRHAVTDFIKFLVKCILDN